MPDGDRSLAAAALRFDSPRLLPVGDAAAAPAWRDSREAGMNTPAVPTAVDTGTVAPRFPCRRSWRGSSGESCMCIAPGAVLLEVASSCFAAGDPRACPPRYGTGEAELPICPCRYCARSSSAARLWERPKLTRLLRAARLALTAAATGDTTRALW